MHDMLLDSYGLCMILMHPCLISHTHSRIKQDSFWLLTMWAFVMTWCSVQVFNIYLAFFKFSETASAKNLDWNDPWFVYDNPTFFSRWRCFIIYVLITLTLNAWQICYYDYQKYSSRDVISHFSMMDKRRVISISSNLYTCKYSIGERPLIFRWYI
jgi:hypothetical protein